MPPAYRLVHFTPDPVTEERFLVGALVRDAGGGVTGLAAYRAPCQGCIGDRPTRRALLRLFKRIPAVKVFNHLPPALEPEATLGEPRDIPTGVDPVTWVDDLLRGAMTGGRRFRTIRTGPTSSGLVYLDELPR